ncbi:PREDICTED: putative uncharacterized protein CXorf58 homolog, partial [Crocodylus porosus]|uniref:putative uncharacterized protein CXorf58 homolog n=1 Tax=Crocodylus porosus TaxID=8502 RepID=UPI00093D3C54
VCPRRAALALAERAARTVQRAWWRYLARRLFRLLTRAVRAAECCVTHEIVKRVSPLEAELIKDPSMQYKVRFRFAGHEFPPFIVFKIFHHTEGRGSKYISGKRIIIPSSEAATDACKLMGCRRYYEQMIQDKLQYQKHKITDEIDVATVKDYMQYVSNLDETPAHFGGRENYWRRLSLENFPRTMIMYDIVEYAQSGSLSDRLKKELKLLLLRPQNEEVLYEQLMSVSQVRLPSPCSTSASASSIRSYWTSSLAKTSGRRSSQALQKITKMKKVYMLEKKKEEQISCDTNTRYLTEDQETPTSPSEDLKDQPVVLLDEEWEREAATLYAWSQALSLEDIGLSSSTATL